MQKKIRIFFTCFGCLIPQLLWGFLFLVEDSLFAMKSPPPICHEENIHEFILMRKIDKSAEVLRFRRENAVADLPNDVAAIRAEWTIFQPPIGEADSVLAQRIITELCRLSLAQGANHNISDSLGFHKSDLRVEFLFLERGQAVKTSFTFGNDLPGRRIAVLVENEKQAPAVYALPLQVARILMLPNEIFRNHRVMRMNVGTINHVKVIFAGKEKFSMDREGNSWVLKQGKKNLGRGNEEATKFLNRMSTLRGLEIVKIHESREQCEKQAKDVKIEFSGIGQKEEIFFSSPRVLPDKKTKDLQIIACSSNRSALFGVHRDMWKYLTVDISQLKQIK